MTNYDTELFKLLQKQIEATNARIDVLYKMIKVITEVLGLNDI